MVFTFTYTVDLRGMAAVLFALTAFGYAYNRWVADITSNGHDRGYLSLIVALGCFVSIVGLGFMLWSWQVGLLAFVCFVASGTPMILGSILRYVRARADEEARARLDAERELSRE